MARGFAMTLGTKKYAGWYGHEQDFAAKNFPANVRFVLDANSIPEVASLRVERDTLPPSRPFSLLGDLLILAKTTSTPQEKTDAQTRLNGRPKPGGP